VANSGGTNISVLPLGASSSSVQPAQGNDLVEDLSRRLLTPNTRLFNLSFGLVDGLLRYTVGETLDFSDRPQFIAQHQTGTLVFSTLPTTAAGNGTVRYVDTSVPNRPEVYLMHRNLVTPTNNAIAIEGIDSLRVIRPSDGADMIVMWGRPPGSTTTVQSPPLPVADAIAYIRSQGVTQANHHAGVWNRAAITLGDTTYIAASGDRSMIAIGEGARAPFGRVLLCCTISQGERLELGLVSETQVIDLVGNAAERVFGVDINQDGSLGVARGAQATYFFTGRESMSLGAGALRLQGEFRTGMAGGAGGAALHPAHAGVLTADPLTRLSFVATSSRTIKIIDTVHFYERGEIHLRENVVGPLRTFLPSESEIQGVPENDPNRILVKVLAVTEGDHIVVINVRRKDLGLN
jgi:hypothetical protein